MMDPVILPETAGMQHAAQPVQHEIGHYQEQHRLQPSWQRGEWAMAVVVKGDQLIGIMDVEDHAGAEHEQADTEYAREHRNNEPVANVGDELALAPPRNAGIASPEMAKDREHHSQPDCDRDHLFDRLAEHLDDFKGQIGHVRRLSGSALHKRYPCALKEP